MCIAASETVAIVDAIRDAQQKRAMAEDLPVESFPEVRVTLYEQSPAPDTEGCLWMDGHNCWDEAYSTAALWQWLLTQRGGGHDSGHARKLVRK